ncbi:MAG: DUF4382 domain-containing protein, partial [Eudoraea sp.]|nr:DUF4382 domain-containing protein [Eudoraea sp.]
MKTKISLIVLVLFGLVLCNCSEDTGGSDTGRLRVQLTDAPFPYDLIAEANVTIFKIEARYKKDDDGMDDEMDTENDSSEDGGRPFITLMEIDKDINLLELTNGVTENLVDMEVPAGEYDLIRIYVRGVNVLLKDGRMFDLKVPSGPQTGIKVFIDPPLVVAGGLTADLLLDFDVSRSFVARGNPNKEEFNGFNFKPVIKASNLTTSGSLAGNVFTTLEDETQEALEGAQVALYIADTLNTTTFSNEDGSYMVMGLEAGSYTVEVQLDTYETQTVEGVSI